MDGIIAEFPEAVLLGLVLHFENFKRPGDDPFNVFEVLQKRADNSDSEQVGKADVFVCTLLSLPDQLFTKVVETLKPILDGHG